MDTRIYTITHKQFQMHEQADPEIYIPLHVGRKLGEDLGYLSDATGDSISEKNREYCELTGIYWIWKNITCDVVGIAHYRRFFVSGQENEILTRAQAEDMLKDHDILLSISCFVDEESVYRNFEKWHNIDDLNCCRQVLSEKYPDDLPAFDLAMACRLFSGGNMFVTRKQIFDDYCSWLFDILFEVEKRTDLSGYDAYQKRLFGFLAERLLRVYVLARKFRVKELWVGQTDL